MNHEKLSLRLERVADFVPQDARLADIGSDHAYLPTYLMREGRLLSAVAGEVVEGPFKSAQRQVRQLGLEDKITVRLADGLLAIQEQDQIDTITICGMGGDLIASILEKGYQAGKLEGVKTLILQPNVDEGMVRSWLMTHHFSIQEEVLLEEKGRLYEIIVAQRQKEAPSYSPKDLKFGYYLRRQPTDLFKKKWQAQAQKIQKVLQQLEGSKQDQWQKKAEFMAQYQEIKEILK